MPSKKPIKPQLADPKRFLPIESTASIFSGLGFADKTTFTIDNDQLLIADPTYVADVYNDEADPKAQYLRRNAVFVIDFGGDGEWPVWWKSPYLVIPISLHPPTSILDVDGIKTLAEQVTVDSGSLCFLPLSPGVPSELASEIDRIVTSNSAAKIWLPKGLYRVVYDQHNTPEDSSPGLCRNVVAELVH